MTRIFSGAVLLALAIAVVWFAPALLFLLAAELLLVLACREFAALAAASHLAISTVLTTAAAALMALSFSTVAVDWTSGVPIDTFLMTVFVTLAVASLLSWRGGGDAVATASASAFPVLYLGLPVGAMIAIRETRGAEGLFLLMLTVFASDTAQYYTGRAFGRRPLAPVVSPKKTIEGAVGGFVVGAIVHAAVGAWWMPAMPVALRALTGVLIVALGIAGDLFESMLKRSAGVKDSSALIPGHGGVLDRIDALLFAAPVYYVVLHYV
ncbi:MAG: phosphatidate cytidylyltransferase [Acidobacteriaceae bacterium]|nr:phosphatidate cytidylyltransferase [Acidobacteriaceae bacterium]